MALSRRTFLGVLSTFASSAAVAQRSKITPQTFAGKWTGYWDNKWPMSLEVSAIHGRNAHVHYTNPDRDGDGSAVISGNTLKYQGITLTLTSDKTGNAVGVFPAVTRSVTMTKE